jgi:hypothetical protein
MADTRVSFCQYSKPNCFTCKDFNRCDAKTKPVKKKKPTTRTCPECGYVNGRDDWNCARCDHPIRW